MSTEIPGLARLRTTDPAAADQLDAWARRALGALDGLDWAAEQFPGVVAGGSRAGWLDALVTAARSELADGEAWALSWTGDLARGEASFLQLAGASGAVPAPGDISRTVVAVAVRTGKATWIDQPQADERFAGAASLVGTPTGAVGCIPIAADAALYVSSPPGHRIRARSRVRLEALVRLTRALWTPPRPTQAPAAGVAGLVGSSRPMLELFAAIRAFAAAPWPALILGDTGTGKEAVARALHACSPRAAGPFVAINCAAVPDELAESTFFGHERGAFTGADKRREGLLDRAKGGTLFLDEVGELSPRVQAKLLRVLQEGTYERVGGQDELRFGGRIVAATLRAIDRNDKAGFRADLYHRLSACVLRVPALDARREDIPALAEALFARARAEVPTAARLQLGAGAVEALSRRSWPGNVRELENVLRAALLRALAWGDPEVGREHLESEPDAPAGDAPADGLLAATDRFQQERVREALAACGGNRADAAKRLGVSRQWLYRLLARWGE